MANIKSAKKKARQSEKRKIVNLARKSAIKTAIKKVLIAVENNESIDTAKKLLADVASKLARAKSKKLIHRNTASRKLSRLAKRINKLSNESHKSQEKFVNK